VYEYLDYEYEYEYRGHEYEYEYSGYEFEYKYFKFVLEYEYRVPSTTSLLSISSLLKHVARVHMKRDVGSGIWPVKHPKYL